MFLEGLSSAETIRARLRSIVIARREIMMSARDYIGTLSIITNSEEGQKEGVMIIFWFNVAMWEGVSISWKRILYREFR